MARIQEIHFVRSPLDDLTREGELYRKLNDDGTLECFACGHRCIVKPGRRGICKVRYNEHGVLRVPYGYVGALQCDPTEKKPFFHVYPGSERPTLRRRPQSRQSRTTGWACKTIWSTTSSFLV